MSTLADNFRQKMKDLVRSPAASNAATSSNRGDSTSYSLRGGGEISVISKQAVLHNKETVFGASQSSVDGNQSNKDLNNDDLELLAKIERQNRLLEADTKSMKSVSSEKSITSRRSSNGSASPTSTNNTSSSGCDNTGNVVFHNENSRAWILWGQIVNDWDEYKRKNSKQLREMIRCGIPHHFRGLVWQLLCNAHNSPYKIKYGDLLKQTSPSEKLIRRDIARTYPEQDFFKDRNGIGQEVLFNVIKAYSLVDREVGYCQGSAFIVGLLLMQMPEEEAFAVFTTLMQEYRLRELFKPSMAELGLCMYQLENLIQEHAPELMIHFHAQAFHTSMFASSWFLTLFATTFDLGVASRIMDVFISEGMEIIFRLGLAMLLGSQQQLIQMDMEGMLKLIQKELPEFYNKDPDLLFQKGYLLVRYNAKKMKKLEKEYMTMRSKEQEEQVEMRKLHTENRLLRQRIEALEIENGTLADKLIQDRVNRALEAEEKIIMGKELSIAKRQAKLSQTGSLNSAAFEDDVPGNDSANQFSETFVLHLQQDLVQAKLREAEASSTMSELQEKVCDLEERNRELTDQSKVVSLQDELIATKLREAEAKSVRKDLTHKLHLLEESWQKHINRTNATRRSVLNASSKTSKVALQELQEELISAKFRETKLISQFAEASQRVTELETTNQICTSQLRRAEDDRSILKEKCRVAIDNEKVLQQQLNEVNTHLAHSESKNQEALMSLRIREADNTMKIAELQQEISKLKLQNAESTSLSTDLPQTFQSPASTHIIRQLQGKILKQQRQIDVLRKQAPNAAESFNTVDQTNDSDISDDDSELLFDATVTTQGLDDDFRSPSEIQDTFDKNMGEELSNMTSVVIS
uniref:EVI5-like protein n=1 Tax=Phallusia mammillata TaxID=59560 RepID=A0A6F9DC67_9ASCI|nr:EVI5-like protein [Phallusia mammillata]